MKRLTTAKIAEVLGLPPDGVRWMVRAGKVAWGVYKPPKTRRFGRGTYYYIPALFGAAMGLSDRQVNDLMEEV